jgi:hypothetical protein
VKITNSLILSFALLFTLCAKAISFEEVNQKLQQNGVESGLYNEILGKRALDWGALTSDEKEMSAKGVIISMDMETSDDIDKFQRHTQSVVQCMDNKSHGLNLKVSVGVNIPLMQCAATAYRKYCTICKP